MRMSWSALRKRKVAGLSPSTSKATRGEPPRICLATVAAWGWALRARMDERGNLLVAGERLRDARRGVGLASDPQMQGFEPLQQHPGVERRHRRAGLPQQHVDVVLDAFLRAQDEH